MARRDLTGAVDFVQLEHFTAGDEAVTTEVLDLFTEQAAIWMRLLDPEAEDGWRDGAHTLKGAALGIGANDLAAACGEAEERWEVGTGAKAVMRNHVSDALNRVLSDIAAYRHELALRGLR